MEAIVSRLDIAQIFCDVDDFCQHFECHWQQQPQLPSMPGERRSYSRMSLSEVMTIAIAFHGSGYRCFKIFYTQCVLPRWRGAFPTLVRACRTRLKAISNKAFQLFLTQKVQGFSI